MLADLRSATNDLSPNIATCLSQQLTTIKRSWKDQIENFEHKIKHCNQTVESLHTKSNLVDNQLKKLDGYIISNKETLNENNVMLKSIGDVIENIDARLCQIEQMKQIAYEEEPFVERQKETSLNVREKTQVKGTFSPHEKPLPQNCDVLILSDSILRRIVPRKFTPRGRTIKQFIGGGASTCRDFVSNFGQNFEPKKVLINIGTRDVQTPSKGVKEKEFEDLFATVVKTWPHSVIYFLPLINRKDIDNATIHASNKAILRSDRTGKINFTKPFLADENMFYDKVHLNDKIGLPALVKHLKLELEMRQASNRNETVNDSFLRSPKNYKPNQSAERQIQSPQPPWPTYNPPPYPWYPPLQNRHFNAVPWFPPPPPPPPFWGLPWSTPQQNFVKG
ncbi:hypothetical protein FSP39_022029 [Pinctada imbricata]|nr:hypothetical protein FSP39_022029 [Pinctada imbricata]